MANENSPKMTIEERLVQHIKTNSLALLVDDEDAITELTRRAIREALLQPRRIQGSSSYNDRQEDAPVVEAAREIAKQAIQKLVDEEVQRIKDDPKALPAVRSAIALMLPLALQNSVMALFNDLAKQSAGAAMLALVEAQLIPRDRMEQAAAKAGISLPYMR